MGKIGEVKLAALEAVGDEAIFADIADGMSAHEIIKKYNVGWTLFHKWLDAKDGRREEYEHAKQMAAHFFASEASRTADEMYAIEASVNAAKLKVETAKWRAAKLSAEYDTRQRDVAVNISINDLHAQAAALLSQVGGDVIDGDAIDVTDVGDDDE